jgi:hypothetical protein
MASPVSNGDPMMTCPICGEAARFVATSMRGTIVLGRSYYHDYGIHHVGDPIVPPVVHDAPA